MLFFSLFFYLSLSRKTFGKCCFPFYFSFCRAHFSLSLFFRDIAIQPVFRFSMIQKFSVLLCSSYRYFCRSSFIIKRHESLEYFDFVIISYYSFVSLISYYHIIYFSVKFIRFLSAQMFFLPYFYYNLVSIKPIECRYFILFINLYHENYNSILAFK